jgi:hypothetical protein
VAVFFVTTTLVLFSLADLVASFQGRALASLQQVRDAHVPYTVLVLGFHPKCG